MTLTDFTDPGLMLPFLQGRDTAAVIGEMAGALVRAGYVRDEARFLRAAMERERRGGTAFEDGLAFPHGRGLEVETLAFAVGRSAVPLSWAGGGRVRLVFLSAVPDGDGGAYLGLISGFSRWARDPGRRRAMLEGQDGAAMLEALDGIPVYGSLTGGRLGGKGDTEPPRGER